MNAAIDPVDLAGRLIACPSVTPADGGAMAVLAEALAAIGFAVHRFAAGEAPDGPIENLFAVRGAGAPHLAFAGHTDVVPPGEGWASDPFTATVADGVLYGRGAVDMKGAIAAFVAAAAEVRDHPGTVSLIITGDEEGPATYGTRSLIAWMAANGQHPDLCLVGEPTSQSRLGDMMKIGRRGSVNMWIDVPGTQGHVAYPHLADNPAPRLVRALARLSALELDRGNEWFQPSNLEITDIAIGNPAANVIPARATARINIRFNDMHSGEALVDQVRAILLEEAPRATLTARISGESFLTAPGALSGMLGEAITEVTGLVAELSTTGGTSDARFLSRICPVVEFGLPNATMHKLDEAVAVDDLRQLARIYAALLRRVLPG
ncbi:succinyl-diaminopimelate desuccinylase [Sphingomonas quercus]|uniref:Succinyl-diaminopimelate desuccinylase n=1 Tax=Sphingomonas quercus TaxID=2842451 RepID=A0ABS6BLB9_9SPHN|nr:succinyl-diaminopimelate desuccinylase [Sphingomonas quercus]MBU3079100.1 succinyl-diaminopimelate desuccinylase [Sphingomonas quercus]